MTLDRLVDVLRELRSLNLVHAVISQQGSDPAWQDVLTLIDHRVFWLRACLNQEDPGLITSADAILHAERNAASATPEPPAWTTDVAPVGTRVH